MWNQLKKIIPNIITTIRAIMSVAACGAIVFGNVALAIALFVTAAATDYIDGKLARKWNVVSKYGKIADPMVDKLLIIGVAGVSTLFINPILAIPAILESSIIVRAWISHKTEKKEIEKFDVTMAGKIKMWPVSITIGLGLFSAIIPVLSMTLLPLIITAAILQIITFASYTWDLSIPLEKAKEKVSLKIQENNNSNNKYKKTKKILLYIERAFVTCFAFVTKKSVSKINEVKNINNSKNDIISIPQSIGGEKTNSNYQIENFNTKSAISELELRKLRLVAFTNPDTNDDLYKIKQKIKREKE